MAVTSIRESILEHIRTVAMPLIIADAVYNLSVKTVSRVFKEPKEISKEDYPYIIILDDFRTAYTWLTNFEYTTGQSQNDIKTGMLIGLMAYVQIQDPGKIDLTGLLSKECNKMHSDLLIAMHDDESLGGYANSGIAILSSVNAINLADKFVGAVFHLYSIKYDFAPSNNT